MNGKVDCKEDGRVVTGRCVGQDKKRKEFFIGIGFEATRRSCGRRVMNCYSLNKQTKLL